MTPNGWQVLTLRDVCSLEYGKSLPATMRRAGPIPVFGSNGIVGLHTEALIPGPGIVVGRKGSIGEVAWSEHAFWPIDTTYWIDRLENADLRWLFNLLKWLDLRGLNTATGIPGLNREDAYGLAVSVPPLGEQRKIAAILSSVDEAIEATQAVIAQLQVVKKAMMAELLTRGLPGRHTRFKMTEIGEVPEEWSVARVDEVTVSCDSMRVPVKSADREKRRGPYRYFGASGPIDTIDDFIFEGTRLLVAEDGFNLLNRVTPIAFVVHGKYWVNNHAHVLDTNGVTDLRFLAHFFSALNLEPYLTGFQMPKLNAKALAAIRVPVPPREEQCAVSDVVESVQHLVTTEEEGLVAAQRLKSALMSVLLTGEVRVRPDTEVA
jgi:type I restriction enzyme, S subunit